VPLSAQNRMIHSLSTSTTGTDISVADAVILCVTQHGNNAVAAKEDLAKVKRCFEGLQTVAVYSAADCSKKQLELYLEEHTKASNFSDTIKILIFYYSGHGRRMFMIGDTVLMNENQLISINDIKAYYNKPHLHNITKIFLLDTCRNHVSVFVDIYALLWQPGLFMNAFSRPLGTIPHVFTAWSCDQGKKAPAHKEFGSVWSQLLCDELNKTTDKLVLFEEILEVVREEVHKYQRQQEEPPPSPRYEKVSMPKSPYFGPKGWLLLYKFCMPVHIYCN